MTVCSLEEMVCQRLSVFKWGQYVAEVLAESILIGTALWSVKRRQCVQLLFSRFCRFVLDLVPGAAPGSHGMDGLVMLSLGFALADLGRAGIPSFSSLP